MFNSKTITFLVLFLLTFFISTLADIFLPLQNFQKVVIEIGTLPQNKLHELNNDYIALQQRLNISDENIEIFIRNNISVLLVQMNHFPMTDSGNFKKHKEKQLITYEVHINKEEDPKKYAINYCSKANHSLQDATINVFEEKLSKYLFLDNYKHLAKDINEFDKRLSETNFYNCTIVDIKQINRKLNHDFNLVLSFLFSIFAGVFLTKNYMIKNESKNN